MKNILDDETVQYRLKFVLWTEDKNKSIAQAARDTGVAWKMVMKYGYMLSLYYLENMIPIRIIC